MYLGPYNKTSTPLGHRRACRMETPASARNPTSAQFLNAHIFHSFIHSLIHSFTHSFISSVQFNSPPSFVPLISFIHSSVQFSSVHSFVHLIPFFHSCMHAFFRISIVIYVYIYVYIHISLPLHMYIHVNTRLCVYNSIEDQRMAFHRVSMKVV